MYLVGLLVLKFDFLCSSECFCLKILVKVV